MQRNQKNNVLRGERCWISHIIIIMVKRLFENKTFVFSIAIHSPRRLLVTQLCWNANVAGVVQWVVPSPNLLQCEDQGAFIDLIQGLGER